MRQIYIAFLLLITTWSCSTVDKQAEKDKFIERYIEQETPFTDLFYYRIKNNNWIRNPKNIIIVHETFKLSFYDFAFTKGFLDQKPYYEGDFYTNVPLRSKIDSLVFTYPNFNGVSKYYKEFWERRKSEQNDSVVYLVLNEVQKIIKGNTVDIRQEYVNHKFAKMINIFIDLDKEIDKIKVANTVYSK